MKKFGVVTLLVMVMFGIGFITAPSSKAAEPLAGAASIRPVGAQDFVLVNRTGVTINNLYISPSDTNDWQEDVLGQAALSDGEAVTIRFKRSEQSAYWDLKVTDSSGNALIWNKLNLLQISKVTLYFNNGSPTASFE